MVCSCRAASSTPHRKRSRGACACATCHVYVEEGWFEKLPSQRDEEIDMLDMALEVQPNSRLSCQIICSDETDGIKVTLAPE